MKRVVTAFLQMTDRYRGPSLLLAATNHPTLLDVALWRRFDEVLTFKVPSVQHVRQLLRLRLRHIPHAGIDVDKTASQLKGLPHAAGEKLIDDARRRALLRNSGIVEGADIEAVIHGVVQRPW